MQIPEDQMEQIYVRLSSLVQHQVSVQIQEEQFDQIVEAVVSKVKADLRQDLALFKQELLADLAQITASDPLAEQHSPRKKSSLKDWW